MKRAERLAWIAFVGLLAIAVLLLTGGILYLFTAFWAGAMLAFAQAVVVGLVGWGLMLARQAQELGEVPGKRVQETEKSPPTGFRMSMGDDTPSFAKIDQAIESRTLDTKFQRLLVVLAGIILISLSGVSGWLVYSVYQWAQAHAGETVAIAGTYAKPMNIDELGMVIGLAAAGIYGVLWWISRVRRDTEVYGEAVGSNFTLGLAGMVTMGVVVMLGYLKVSFASETAAGVIAALMLLQGLELIVNSMRSYSSLEELDQEAIDLQALPIVPMLSSMWLGGLKMLFAQSMGLSGSGKRESGVVARMMPRAILAIIVIAIGVSCVRVVEPGTVGILERFGYVATDKDGIPLPESILQPGMHFTLPWLMDEIVTIPTEQLQVINVGEQLHAPEGWKNVDFQFWMYPGSTPEKEIQNEFITGDAGAPQLLETYIEVRWRVKDPARFYASLSHSEFYDKSGDETKTLPIYQAMVQQCTSYAVTHTFGIHSLEQIMMTSRAEVESHCRDILQNKLDSLDNGAVKGSGIEVVSLVIRDLHPPFWHVDVANEGEPEIAGKRMLRGPASAFEFVVSAREYMEQLKNAAQADSIRAVNMAKGNASAEIANATVYKLTKIASAQGEAGRLVIMLQGMSPADKPFQVDLLQRQLKYGAMKDLLDPVNKIIVDPRVSDVSILQPNENGTVQMRPLPP